MTLPLCIVRRGVAAVFLGALAPAVLAAPSSTISSRAPLEVETLVRDFTLTHPDFQRSYATNFVEATTGLVAPRLDREGKPELSETANLLASDAREIESSESFRQWFRDVPGVNRTFRRTIEMVYDQATGLYTFQRDLQNSNGYFPVDGEGPGPNGSDGLQPTDHNFYFTTEISTSFVYTDPAARPDKPMVLSFLGDDDVWVFLNGQLIMDLGGVHGQVAGSVNIDEQAAALGLVPGTVYSLHVFHAERRQWNSNFKLQTSMELTPTTIRPLFD